MPDFETSSPPEPGRLSKLRASAVAAPRRFMASVVAAPKRVSAIAAGLLRSINRHRWAASLVVFCVVVMAASIAGFVVYEPWPPEYSESTPIESGSCPYYDGGGGGCTDVFTDATSEKALTYITEELASPNQEGAVYISFYHNDGDGSFAVGCKFDEHSPVEIAYRGETVPIC